MQNMIKKAWLHARNAFWISMYPPTLMQIDNKTSFKHPAPANAGRPQHQKAQDFRTAYKDSPYNVRYHHQYANRMDQQHGVIIGKVKKLNPDEDILLYGLLKQQDKNDPKKKAQAKTYYNQLMQENESSKQFRQELEILQYDQKDDKRKYIRDMLEYQQVKYTIENVRSYGLDEVEQIVPQQKQGLGYYRTARIMNTQAQKKIQQAFKDQQNQRFGDPPKHTIAQ